jgi:hypothetical protein
MHTSQSYLRVHCWLRWAFGPFRGQVHRLTSPKVRTFHVFPPVKTRRKSAPFRVGYPSLCSPIRSITERRSLFPSSPTLCSIPLPYGWDTTSVGSIGLTQLSMKKSASGAVGVCTPVGVLHVAAPSSPRRSSPPTFLVMASQPLWPFVLHEVLNDASLTFNLTGLPSSTSASRLAEVRTLFPELRTSDDSSARLGRDTWTLQGSHWFHIPLCDTSSQTLRGVTRVRLCTSWSQRPEGRSF